MEFGDLLTGITIVSLAVVAICVVIQFAMWVYRGLSGQVRDPARHWAAGVFVCVALVVMGGVLLAHFTIGKAAFDALFGDGIVSPLLWNAVLVLLTVGAARLIWSTHDAIRDG